MLSSVLRSKRAIKVNVEIMRAFVRMRRYVMDHHDLAEKMSKLEKKYDSKFKIVFDAIFKLMEAPKKKRKIGFRVGE